MNVLWRMRFLADGCRTAPFYATASRLGNALSAVGGVRATARARQRLSDRGMDLGL